jgi:hypothetical protein
MSTFEDDRYRWRETYFVLFPAGRRPMLETVEHRLAAISRRYSLSNLTADDEGRFESVTVISPDDYAALDICYTGGEEVLEQGADLVRELAPTTEPSQRPTLKRIKECDGRFDVLHFEQVSEVDDDDGDEMLDPGALLAVLEELARLTGGVAIDPQSGTILSGEEEG